MHRQMIKIGDLIQYLQAEYANERLISKLPSLVVELSSAEDNEDFQANYFQQEIYLKASQGLGAVYGILQLQAAARSQDLADYLGESHPHFPWRPIWLCANQVYSLTKEIGIGLPAFLQQACAKGSLEEQADFQQLCCQILEYGFNAVILGCMQSDGGIVASENADFYAICQAFHTFGLKVIIKPTWRFLQSNSPTAFSICPCDPHYKNYLHQLLQAFESLPCNGIIWETTSHHRDFMAHPDAEEKTWKELVVEEIKCVEESLPPHQTLIYYFSTPHQAFAEKQAQGFEWICDRVGNKTAIAFSAVAGLPYQDHCPLHPIWDVLRKSLDASSTPLLPIVNSGAISHGEGLWPALPLDLIDQVISRCKRHLFAGIIALTNRIPTKKGLLSCPLWVLGQAQWRTTSVSLLAETWFRAYRPDISFESYKSCFNRMRALAIELNLLRTLANEKGRDLFSTEDCRLKAEALFAQLQELQMAISKKKDSSVMPLADYFTYFHRDARRILLHFLQSNQIPLTHFLTHQDEQPSFWSTSQIQTIQNGKGGVKIHFLDHPYKGEPGSLLEKIYLENNLII